MECTHHLVKKDPIWLTLAARSKPQNATCKTTIFESLINQGGLFHSRMSMARNQSMTGSGTAECRQYTSHEWTRIIRFGRVPA